MVLENQGLRGRYIIWQVLAQGCKSFALINVVDEHVMGGYKFLMRYYNVGDDIYLFGFSRGAYTARFLAEMLDHVGLLSAGNEEMTKFAWKAFQSWQQRADRTEKEKKQKKYLMNYMFAFRETFSRPVRRIRFLGLFDTVNSVPQFEKYDTINSSNYHNEANTMAVLSCNDPSFHTLLEVLQKCKFFLLSRTGAPSHNFSLCLAVLNVRRP